MRHRAGRAPRPSHLLLLLALAPFSAARGGELIFASDFELGHAGEWSDQVPATAEAHYHREITRLGDGVVYSLKAGAGDASIITDGARNTSTGTIAYDADCDCMQIVRHAGYSSMPSWRLSDVTAPDDHFGPVRKADYDAIEVQWEMRVSGDCLGEQYCGPNKMFQLADDKLGGDARRIEVQFRDEQREIDEVAAMLTIRTYFTSPNYDPIQASDGSSNGAQPGGGDELHATRTFHAYGLAQHSDSGIIVDTPVVPDNDAAFLVHADKWVQLTIRVDLEHERIAMWMCDEDTDCRQLIGGGLEVPPDPRGFPIPFTNSGHPRMLSIGQWGFSDIWWPESSDSQESKTAAVDITYQLRHLIVAAWPNGSDGSIDRVQPIP